MIINTNIETKIYGDELTVNHPSFPTPVKDVVEVLIDLRSNIAAVRVEHSRFNKVHIVSATGLEIFQERIQLR